MKEPKAKITISVDVSLIVWIDEKVKEGVFKSRSEGIRRCIELQREYGGICMGDQRSSIKCPNCGAEKMEIESVGFVRQLNRSLYVLVPHKIAKAWGLVRGSRYKLFKSKQDHSLVYRFSLQPPSEPPADIQEPPV